jgi:hypothetical protein
MDVIENAISLELSRGNVDRDREMMPFGRATRALSAGFIENPSTDRNDEAACFKG